MTRSTLWVITPLVILISSMSAQVDPSLLAGMKARSIGPAGMSGRVAAVAVVESNTNIIYVGAATGGVWKSENAGLNWTPLFDDQPVAAIGAISIFQPNPDIVWVGTGEGNPRNSVSVGNGLYKSIDGGKTWAYLGLKETERIHRILLHPTNPNIAYVGAMGKAWGDHPDRGVYKTIDGGKTWKKILYTNNTTGVGDMVMDPTNPDKLIVGMWDFRRWPWFFRSGGPGGGMYMTFDGGDNWKKLTPEDGLPEGEIGRIGLSFSLSHPEIVYALVEAKDNQLLKSVDGGSTWKLINKKSNIMPRPFYFGDIQVDPELPNRVYNIYSSIQVSDDGGKSFTGLVGYPEAHPDHHAIWINPKDGRHIVIGNDGGVAISRDRGNSWRFVTNLPLAQYYHIRVDNEKPYNVYGGMQDNGSWRGPSESWKNTFQGGGILTSDWDVVGFGDGFDTSPDPEDAQTGYSMSQQGNIQRWDLRTGNWKSLKPAHPDGVRLRFNWNSAFAQDPFDPATIYFGSQFVHKSTDRGESWTIISKDLTTNKKEWQKQTDSGGLTKDATGAENFTTIIALEVSPLDKNIIWAGTDDGRLHVTQNGGKSWTSVEKKVKGVPANTWIPHVTPSPHAKGTAFVVFDDHRRSNIATYVYKTTNFGKSWKSIATKDIDGYALKILQDPVDPDVLFLGTEFGLYFSLNGGKKWDKWTHGVPTVGVRDLAYQADEADLVIGTHGRAAYIIDDISPLRTVSRSSLRKELHLFDIPDAQQFWSGLSGGELFPGAGEFLGENEPYGAMITFSVKGDNLPHPDEDKERARKASQRKNKPKKSDKDDDDKDKKKDKKPKATIEISDADGTVIRTMKVDVHQGINRANWGLKRKAFRSNREREDDGEGSGPEILPGTYTVKVTFGKTSAEKTVKVLTDPRYNISTADRQAKYDAIIRMGTLREATVDAMKQITSTRDDIKTVLAAVKTAKKRAGKDADKDADKDAFKALTTAADSLKSSLKRLENKIQRPSGLKGIVRNPDWITNKIRAASGQLGSSWDAPNDTQRILMRQAEAAVAGLIVDFNKVMTEEVAKFHKEVESAGIKFITGFKPVEIGEK